MDATAILALVTGLLPPLAMAVCVVLFVRAWRAGSLGTRTFALALGFIGACALPAVFAQILYVVSVGGGEGLRLLVYAPFAWWVLIGGGSVVAFFDASAKNMTGHRDSTMMDNIPYFTVLAAMQLLFLAAAVSLRLKEGRELRDPVILGVGIFVLVNSLVAIPFPWWGT